MEIKIRNCNENDNGRGIKRKKSTERKEKNC